MGLTLRSRQKLEVTRGQMRGNHGRSRKNKIKVDPLRRMKEGGNKEAAPEAVRVLEKNR